MKKIIFYLLCIYSAVSNAQQRVCITAPLDIGKPEPLQAFGEAGKFWNKNIFYVYFLNERHIQVQCSLSDELRARKRVMYYANKWGRKVSNIKFIETKDSTQSDIRVSLLPGGSWSYVGLDNRYIPKEVPTMQLGWLISSRNNLKAISAVVLHEFGHFLGLGHEHNHPENTIKWNYVSIYKDYEEIGWNKEMVNEQVFKKYSKSNSNYTTYDQGSIMHYPIIRTHTLDGYSVGWNYKLSETDKYFINSIYRKE